MHNRTARMLSDIKKRSSNGDDINKIAADTNTSPRIVKGLLTTTAKPKRTHGWRELVEHANVGKAFYDDADITQRYSTAHIDVDRPIAVVYTGDWHLGDRYTNYETWRAHIEAIMNNENIYLVALGDENQNARSFKNLSMVLEQVLSPALQIELLNSLFDELIDNRKILAKVTGNHDVEFDERIYGTKLVGYTDKLSTIPIFDNRGLLTIKVGNESYSNLLFHKSRFRSFIRPAHGAFREWQMSYPAEVVAGGHDHVPGIEIMYNRDAVGDATEVFLIKSGTFEDSSFGWRYFHNGGPMTPTVVYYPNEHRKIVFTNISDAIQYMEK